MHEYLDLIQALSEAHGVSGFETDVRKVIEKRLEGKAEISKDILGNVFLKKAGKPGEPKIMVEAHMDEVGFMVSGIKGNYIKFVPLGVWWDQTLLSNKVIIKTNKGDVKGVIGSKPPHIMTPQDAAAVYPKKFMFIDVGAASAKEIAEMGIRIGDPIVPDTYFEALNENVFLGKAFDCRLGCAAVTALLDGLDGGEHPNTVYGVGTVQEELGCRGAVTAVNTVRPDLCIAIEGGYTTDLPGCEMADSAAYLGGGPCVAVMDAGMIPNTALLEFVRKTAEENHIPIQLGCTPAGTDAGTIQKFGSGIPTVLMALPARYIHTYNSLFNYKDFEMMLQLLQCMVKKLDKETVDGIRSGQY